jgi:hypothetical protein
MLETKPQFWSGDFEDASKVLPFLVANSSVEIAVPGRTVEIDLDRRKTDEFVAACTKLLSETPL